MNGRPNEGSSRPTDLKGHGPEQRHRLQRHPAHQPVDVLGGAVDDVAVLDHGLSGRWAGSNPRLVDHSLAYGPILRALVELAVSFRDHPMMAAACAHHATT